MKFLFTLLITASLFITLSAQSNNIKEAAQSALHDMQQLVNDQNYKMVGLDSPNALVDATTGKPISVKVIGLEALRRFQGEENEVQSMLEDHNRVFVPVISNGEIVSAIALDRSGKRWKTASLGMAVPVDEYEAVRRETGQDGNTYMVWVPSMNQYFVARGQGVNLQLASIGQSIGDQAKGRFVPAASALIILQPIALQYNGLPW